MFSGMSGFLRRYWNWFLAAAVMFSVPIAGEMGWNYSQNLGLWVFVAGIVMGKMGLISKA